MELFDSHSHYNDEKFNGDREEVLSQVYNSRSYKFNLCRL